MIVYGYHFIMYYTLTDLVYILSTVSLEFSKKKYRYILSVFSFIFGTMFHLKHSINETWWLDLLIVFNCYISIINRKSVKTNQFIIYSIMFYSIYELIKN